MRAGGSGAFMKRRVRHRGERVKRGSAAACTACMRGFANGDPHSVRHTKVEPLRVAPRVEVCR
eukprot:1868459-Pleurochrysis_carterae.AAC.4